MRRQKRKRILLKRKSAEIKTPDLLLAWKYVCHCGLVAYSFDSNHQIIQATCGHDITDGTVVVYEGRKFYETCPKCGAPADKHKKNREGEMLYSALCPVSLDLIKEEEMLDLGQSLSP